MNFNTGIIGVLLVCNSAILYAQQIDTLILQNHLEINYKSGADQLTDDHKVSIDSLLNNAIQHPLLRIEGHTDDIGSLTFNEALAQRRASHVTDYIITTHHFSQENIFTNSYGELKPAIANNTNKNRSQNRRVSIGLYSIKKMRLIAGQVMSDSITPISQAKITFSGKNFEDSTFTDILGNWQIFAPDSVFIKLDITADNHFFESKVIKISPALDSRKIKLNLPKLGIGETYKMPNFFFKGNLPILVPSSEPILPLLLQTLSNSDVCIHIKGHVNHPNQPPVKEDHSYFKLSAARAKMVYDYMILNGIPQNRMRHSGFGNWQMIYPKATKETLMAQNRRVEVEIISCEELKK